MLLAVPGHFQNKMSKEEPRTVPRLTAQGFEVPRSAAVSYRLWEKDNS